MKKTIQKLLAKLAKKIIAKQKPQVVAITGSVGKTSTKEAIYAVLDRQFEVRQSEGNYNNEFGVPLTIIGARSAGRCIFGWLSIIFKAYRLSWFEDKKYPKILVLEMGADNPGDIDYLTDIAEPLVSVVTAVAPAHTEFFKFIENIVKEKSVLVKKVKKDGVAILNADDDMVLAMNRLSNATVKTYGFSAKADLYADSISINYNFSEDKKDLGINFKLQGKDKSVSVFFSGAIGKHQLYAYLAAVSVGQFFKMTLVDILEALKNYQPPKGRLRYIPGVKETTLIDDTYNSSPRSCLAAIQALEQIPEYGRKWAVLGDMLELGQITEAEHQKIGRQIASREIGYLVCVGEKSRDIMRGAKDVDMEEDKIFYFSDSEKAAEFIKNKLEKNDILLIKGSQGVRMEKITKALMAQPDKADQLLVRQSQRWLKK